MLFVKLRNNPANIGMGAQGLDMAKDIDNKTFAVILDAMIAVIFVNPVEITERRLRKRNLQLFDTKSLFSIIQVNRFTFLNIHQPLSNGFNKL